MSDQAQNLDTPTSRQPAASGYDYAAPASMRARSSDTGYDDDGYYEAPAGDRSRQLRQVVILLVLGAMAAIGTMIWSFMR